MNTNQTSKFIILILLVVFASTNLAAEEIYRWTDENGVPNYSQYPPNSDIVDVSKQKLEDVTPPGNGQAEDVYNVEAQQKRMAEWREEREQNRKKVRESKKLAAQQQPVTYPQQVRRSFGTYWNRPVYGKPPHQPQHPIARPRPPSAVLPRTSIH